MWKPKPKPPSVFQELFKAAMTTAVHTTAKHAVGHLTQEAARELGEGHLVTRLSGGMERLLDHHEQARRDTLAAQAQSAFATGKIAHQAAAWAALETVDYHAAEQQRLAQELQAERARIAQATPQDYYDAAQRAERASVPVDAFRLYAAAAARGHVRGMTDLGYCYDEGIGTPADKRQAAHWYRQAGNAGHAGAQYNLGLSLHHGEAGGVNQHEAGHWFRLAAQQGHAGAQYHVGNYYRQGLGGLPLDRTEARRWYQLAAAQGENDALTALCVMDAQDRQKPTGGDAPSPSNGTARGDNPHKRGSVPWAREELGVREGADGEDIKAAWRKRIKWAHSDHGGDDDYCADLNLAKKTLLDAL